MDVTGIIMAGGHGRRLGQDKALARLAGVPMAKRVAQALLAVSGEIVLITNDLARHEGLGIPMHRDLVPDLGPVGGVYTALCVTSTTWCLVVGCDYPLVTPASLTRVLDRAARTRADVVVPRLDGRPQPLLAAYRRTCLPALEARVRGRQLKMVELFSDLQVDWLPMRDFLHAGDVERSFHNVNTPEDLARAESFVRCGGRVDGE